MDHLVLLALCHYLRYQPLPDDFWSKLHEAYQMAEKTSGINLATTGCDASYLQGLMLGTMNRTNMLKWEIALVNSWLERWSQEVEISKNLTKRSTFILSIYQRIMVHIGCGNLRLHRVIDIGM